MDWCRRVVVLLSLATALWSRGAAATPMQYSDIRTLSFYLCRPDPECARRFFIDRSALDYNRFLHLFDRYVVETETRRFLVDNFENDAVKRSWLFTMRLASFCTENEVFDSDGYCVCRNGKVCHETSGDVFSFDILSLDFLCVVLIVGIFYYSTRHLSQFRDIYANVMRLRERYRREDDERRRAAPPPTDDDAPLTTFSQFERANPS